MTDLLKGWLAPMTSRLRLRRVLGRPRQRAFAKDHCVSTAEFSGKDDRH